MSLLRVFLTAVLLLASLAPCRADPAPVIHYAPAENLEHIDVGLIDGAEHEIDLAAYVLTDWPVIQELEAFDPQKVQKRYREPDGMRLEAAIDEALSAAFGDRTAAYERYRDAASLDHGPTLLA